MTTESVGETYNARSSELKKENMPTVEEIKQTVEKALSHFGERESDDFFKNTSTCTYSEMEIIRRTSEFRGQLSTKPELVNKRPDKKKVNQANLSSCCEIFSKELHRCLKQEGLKTMMVSNQEGDHFILTTPGKEGNVFIDSTLVQYLKYHKNVFVGTGGQLLGLLKKSAALIRDNRGENPDPEVFFRNNWRNSVVHRC